MMITMDENVQCVIYVRKKFVIVFIIGENEAKMLKLLRSWDY